MKNKIALLTSLLLCCCFFISPSNLFAKKKKHHRKMTHHNRSVDKSQPGELTTVVPLGDLPIDFIFGANKNEIIQFVYGFPHHEYKIYSAWNSGRFYVDPINDVIKNHIRMGHLWEPHLVDLIQKYTVPGTVVLDIGAHIGTHTLILANAVGDNGHVLAFEPQPKIFRELFFNMHLNGIKNVSYFWAGVGSHEGEIELSPFTNGNEGGTGLYGGTGSFVQLMTIDSLKLENVSLMKIDVEGQENQVLAGAKETILRCRPVILIEIMGGNEIATASQEVREMIQNTIKILESMNYTVRQIQIHDYLALPN